MGSAATVPPLSASDRDLLAAARALVIEVCDELRPVLLAAGGHSDTSLKADGTPVSEADLHADRTLADRIEDRFPWHGLVSEERTGSSDGGGWTWVVDPIDGTSNFIAGVPWWCLSIALLKDGHPVLGVVDAPPVDQRFVAERGRGTTLNGTSVTVPDPVDFEDPPSRHHPVLVTAGIIRRAPARVHLNPRVFGSAALDLCQVVTGAAAAALGWQPHVWDVAAAALIVEEAGGAYVTLRRDPLLPLHPGADHHTRTAAGGAGPSAGYVRRLAEQILPPD